MRNDTDYSDLANRCNQCGHRIIMHNGRCHVEMNQINAGKPEFDHSCNCTLDLRDVVKMWKAPSDA